MDAARMCGVETSDYELRAVACTHSNAARSTVIASVAGVHGPASRARPAPAERRCVQSFVHFARAIFNARYSISPRSAINTLETKYD